MAARYTGGFNWLESLMIGFGMLDLAFVMINTGFAQYQIISLEVFYTLMLLIKHLRTTNHMLVESNSFS